MATVTAVPAHGGKKITWTWTGIVTGDTATAVEIEHNAADIIMQVTGTFAGGSSVTWEGSLDNTNFVTLVDPSGTEIAALTATGGSAIRDSWRYIRPVVASGAADAITATLMARIA